MGERGRLSGLNKKYPHRFMCLHRSPQSQAMAISAVALFEEDVEPLGHRA